MSMAELVRNGPNLKRAIIGKPKENTCTDYRCANLNVSTDTNGSIWKVSALDQPSCRLHIAWRYRQTQLVG